MDPTAKNILPSESPGISSVSPLPYWRLIKASLIYCEDSRRAYRGAFPFISTDIMPHLDEPNGDDHQNPSCRPHCAGIMSAQDQAGFASHTKEMEPFAPGGFTPQTFGWNKQGREQNEHEQFEDYSVKYPQKDPPFEVSLKSKAQYPNALDTIMEENQPVAQADPVPHFARVDFSAKSMTMPANPRSGGRETKVTVCDMEADISPVEQISCHVVVESMAPEVESMLRQHAEYSSKTASKLAVPNETYHSGSSCDGDDGIESESPNEDHLCYYPATAETETVMASKEESDGFIVVGAGVQILEDPGDNPYGVPVTKASVDTTRRDSGIRFTLTCIEDGYEDAEVLFDDDFLYEEEMMDPDYFRKKGSGVVERPIPRPAFLRLSTY